MIAVWVPLIAKDGRVLGQTIVDAADADAVQQWTWRRASSGRGGFYAHRAEAKPGGLRHFYLHRVLMGLSDGDGFEVDHINHDTLDNRRSNLRLVTHQGNMQNGSSQRGSTSRYRGVHFDRWTGRWRASVQMDGITYRLGRFVDEESAAAAASEWRKVHMPFAIEP